MNNDLNQLIEDAKKTIEKPIPDGGYALEFSFDQLMQYYNESDKLDLRLSTLISYLNAKNE